MEKFTLFLNLVKQQQSNFFLGCVSLLTAWGERIFSSVLFECPCNRLNFWYGMVFLLGPAIALLLLGYIVSTKMWRLVTGMCQCKNMSCSRRRTSTCVWNFCRISSAAFVAPCSWIAVALLNGTYFECAMSETIQVKQSQKLCYRMTEYSTEDCLRRFPCIPDSGAQEALIIIRAHSQILGWLLIISLILFNVLLTCLARCTSPISDQQLKFWWAYAQEEASLMDQYTSKHSKALAERNLKSFFSQIPPEQIFTPSKEDWEKISSLYKFSTKSQFYSTLHKHVENHGLENMGSVKSVDSADANPAVLDFIDEGRSVV
ncbi:calcium homeostasis modulator protein 6-like isoform 1-T1 [Synchiropus picturatus]